MHKIYFFNCPKYGCCLNKYLNRREEAKAYIENPILRERLVEISEAVLNNEKSVYEIFGNDVIREHRNSVQRASE